MLHALRAAASTDGVRLVLATARSTRCLRRWFGPLVHGIDLVCCNGALHVGPDGHRTRRTLPAASVAALLPALDDAGVGWCLEYGDHFVVSSRSALPWMGTRHRVLRRRGQPVAPDGVLKLCVDRADVGLALAGELPGLDGVQHSTGDGDVLAAGVTKAAVVSSLRGTGRVAAFGNDRNDLDLLREADRSVVVGGIVLRIRRSKTDRDATGAKVAVARGTNPDTDPIAALQHWLRTPRRHTGAGIRPAPRRRSR